MKTVDSIVTACYEMGKVKTGALIVVERDIMLTEYQHTGIELDCIVSEQMLINIFEHNTPLHDGAVIVRGDRITSATCYCSGNLLFTIIREHGFKQTAWNQTSRSCRNE